MRTVWPALAVALVPFCVEAASAGVPGLAELSIEELSNVVVSSVSRRPESLADAPASIYVITGEEIRRSGAKTIPEALRLAPNLQVARIDAREYAISARGFQSGIANKLLVLIDGRTAYTPLFSGVFWDAQDLILADIERIEVISGPGAATWGINAVNGVVNIISRPASNTQGTLSSVGVGTRESSASLRHGGTIGERGFYRVYGKGFRGQESELVDGSPGFDRWQRGQIGFRGDWTAGTDGLTVQGDAYRAYSEERRGGGGLDDLSGGNLLARWTREDDHGAGLELQAYYEHTDRAEILPLQEDLVDVAFKHALPAGPHKITWGAGYRFARDGSDSVPEIAFIPAERNLHWYHLFGQDQFALREDLEVTFGVRLEHNVYTDWEVLPSARLAWTLGENQLIWSALSRAVRAPARLDRDIFIPGTPPFVVGGGPDFQSEIAEVIEVGYRVQPTSALSYSVTAFHHRYDRLRSVELAPPDSGAATIIGNGIEGEITGLEAWGAWQATDDWQLRLGGFVMDQDLGQGPGSTDTSGPRTLGNDPDYQLLLRSAFNISLRHQFDVMLRHVDDLPDPEVPSYTALDLRLGWQATPRLDLSLLLQDVLDSRHGEFGAAPARREFERAAFIKVVWRP